MKYLICKNPRRSLQFMLYAIGIVGMPLYISCGFNGKKEIAQSPPLEVIGVDTFMVAADYFEGRKVLVEGMCTRQCTDKKHIFVMGANPHFMLGVTASEELNHFDENVLHSIVSVEGVIKEERIDSDRLHQWESCLAEEDCECVHGFLRSTLPVLGLEDALPPENFIARLREKISERIRSENKDYVSFYYIVADRYIVE